MQDKELTSRFSALDGITPPAGVKDRLLYERILKEKDTPVNEADSESSVYALIEDKRSDIAAPIETAEDIFSDTDKEENDDPSPQGAALFRQPKSFMYFGIAAACIAVIALGALALSLFSGKNKIDTTPTDSANEMREKIFSGRESIFKLLSDEKSGTDTGGSGQVYQLANGGYLLMKDNGELAVADNNMEIVAKSEGNNVNDDHAKFITSSQELIFFGLYYENRDLQGYNELYFWALDINTLEEVSNIEIKTTDYAVNGRVVSFDVVPYDNSIHTDTGEGLPSDLASFYFVLDYFDDKGMEKSTVFRISTGDKKAAEVFSLTNEKGGDTLQRIEGVYTGNISDSDMPDIFAVSCTMDRLDAASDTGSYLKTYYAYAIDNSGRTEPVNTELFTETDAYSGNSFAKSHTVEIIEDYNQLVILNNITGTVTTAVDSYGKGAETDYDPYAHDLFTITSTSAMPSLGYYGEDVTSRYTMSLQTKCVYSYTGYYDENGEYFSKQVLADMGEEVSKYNMKTEISVLKMLLLSRIDYDVSGKPIKTLVFNSEPYSSDFRQFDSFDGQAVSVAEGQAVIQSYQLEDTDNVFPSDIEDRLHTPDGAYKLSWHM